MGDEERLVDILRHSLILTSIVRNDESGSYEPTGFGRGCLYVENGVTYLFTVRHLLDDSNNEQIGVLLTVADERRAVFSLQPFNHFDLFHMSDDGVFKKGAEGKGIDFLWRRAASNEEFDYLNGKMMTRCSLSVEERSRLSIPFLCLLWMVFIFSDGRLGTGWMTTISELRGNSFNMPANIRRNAWMICIICFLLQSLSTQAFCAV